MVMEEEEEEVGGGGGTQGGESQVPKVCRDTESKTSQTKARGRSCRRMSEMESICQCSVDRLLHS